MVTRMNRSIYNCPAADEGSRDRDLHMRAYALSKELRRLEYEKKLAQEKISRVDRRIDEIQKEIHSIHMYFKEKPEIAETERIVPKAKTKHVTLEY